MKKILLIITCVVFFGCNKDDINNNCNYLLDVGVNLTVNLNFPQFSQLEYTGNAVRVENYGNEGIILYRLNTSTLLAWDGADPSHPPSACSAMSVNSDNTVTCGCGDENTYYLATGTFFGDNPPPCTLKPYRVEAIGNNSYLVSN